MVLINTGSYQKTLEARVRAGGEEHQAGEARPHKDSVGPQRWCTGTGEQKFTWLGRCRTSSKWVWRWCCVTSWTWYCTSWSTIRWTSEVSVLKYFRIIMNAKWGCNSWIYKLCERAIATGSRWVTHAYRRSCFLGSCGGDLFASSLDLVVAEEHSFVIVSLVVVCLGRCFLCHHLRRRWLILLLL